MVELSAATQPSGRDRMVGAAHFPWINRVVACVPSSVVWSGFGRPPAAGEVYSSWSIDGKGLPYIPYDNFQDALDRKFSSAFVHQRSLDKGSPEQRAEARIPIEKIEGAIAAPGSHEGCGLALSADDEGHPGHAPGSAHGICRKGRYLPGCFPLHLRHRFRA